MQSIYQRPTDLVLGILDHELPLEVTVLAAATEQQASWRFEFQIIGESHRVLIRNHERVVWQEVMACIPLTAEACRHFYPFRQLYSHIYHQRGYQAEIWFSDAPVPLLDDPDLEVWFPEVYHQPPVTQLKWALSDTALQWWTLHVYPTNKNAITVLTHSTFERMVFCGTGA